MTLAIGGMVPFSTVDYPGALAAVIFCQGCPWSCRYCHNPHLQSVEPGQPWEEVRDALRRRRGLLEAILFSGGEPLMQPDLSKVLAEVRMMGFQTGLHTGGSFPKHLEKVLPRLNWVGLDIKAPIQRYEFITRCPGSGESAWESLELLQRHKVWHEVRTTWHPAMLPEKDLLALALRLSERGVREWVIQVFRSEGCLDPDLHPCRMPARLLDDLRGVFAGEIHLRSSEETLVTLAGAAV